MFGETAEGWLSKAGLLGLVSSTRHRRYCILSGNELRYYKQKNDIRPAGVIDLKHYNLVEKDSGKQHPYGFRIVSQCRHHRSFIFYADHEQGCQYWMDMVNATLDPFIGKHHACDAPVSSLPPPPPPPPEENYSVLDKWLNRLDLNDHSQSSPPPPPPPSASASASASSLASSVTATATTKTMTNTTIASSSFSSYLSPTLRPYRTSTESLDSIPSETTLSSSAGSRAQLSNAIFTPITTTTTNNKANYHHHPPPPPSHYHPINSPPTQYQTPPSNNNINKRHSNPVAFLSNLKQQHSIRSNQQPSPGDSNNNNNNNKIPAWSLDRLTSSLACPNNNNSSKMVATPRKDWESDELFDFEDEMLYSTDLLRDAATTGVRPPPPPPLS